MLSGVELLQTQTRLGAAYGWQKPVTFYQPSILPSINILCRRSCCSRLCVSSSSSSWALRENKIGDKQVTVVSRTDSECLMCIVCVHSVTRGLSRRSKTLFYAKKSKFKIASLQIQNINMVIHEHNKVNRICRSLGFAVIPNFFGPWL